MWPPTLMMNKATALDDPSQTMTWGAAQLGIGQGVLDAVADGLLDTSGDVLVLVAVWVDAAANDETAVRLAGQAGFELIAAVADPSAEAFERAARPRRLGLVLGDEHEGIDREWLALCRRAVTIPMRPGASSLNVAVAAGILIYHYSR